jgi:ribonuclease VapC
MVLDSSAVMAILLLEAEAEEFIQAITEAPSRMMSAPTLVELAIVAEARRGKAGAQDVDRFVAEAHIEIVPFDAEQAVAARGAWRRYGRGRHRASLNFGDCFSYALARITNDVLLFKGNDFAHTDIMAWRSSGRL